MKKIFTVISALAVAFVMMHASALDLQKVTFKGFTPAFYEKASQLQANPDMLAEEGETPILKKSWTQGNTTYEAAFWGLGKLTDMVILYGENGEPLEMKDVRFFCVALILHGYPKNETIEKSHTSVQAYCSWPTKSTLFNYNNNPDPDLSFVNFNDFVSGTNVKKFQFNNFTQQGELTAYNFFPGIDQKTGDIVTFPIWSPMFGSDLASVVNSTQNCIMDQNGQNYSGFELKAYDDEEYTLTMPFDFYFTNGLSLSGIYNGECELNDMTVEHRTYKFDEFHIFDCGNVSSTSFDQSYDLPFGTITNEIAWGPLSKYYFFGIQNGELFIDTQNGVKFDSSRLFPNNAAGDYDNINMLKGAWFSPNGTNSPVNNNWTLIKPNMVDLGFIDPTYAGSYFPLINPVAKSMVPSGYANGEDNQWSTQDGLYAYYRSVPAMINSFDMALGVPEGLEGKGSDTMTNTYTIDFNKKAIYHYNPNNMNETEELEIVGTFVPEYISPDQSGVQTIVAEEGNVAVKTVNGAIVVVAENNANVAVYTLDGACVANAKAIAGEELTVAAGKGVYVVKVNNTAVKVIL